MPTVFGYWAIKGLGQPCRLLLELAGEDYQDNRFDQVSTLSPPAPPPDDAGRE